MIAATRITQPTPAPAGAVSDLLSGKAPVVDAQVTHNVVMDWESAVKIGALILGVIVIARILPPRIKLGKKR